MKTFLVEKPEYLIEKPLDLSFLNNFNLDEKFFFTFRCGGKEYDIELTDLKEYFYAKDKTFISAKFVSQNEEKRTIIHRIVKKYFYENKSETFEINQNLGRVHHYLDEMKFDSSNFELILNNSNNDYEVEIHILINNIK